jgi:DNA-binding FadR family transcriptional regulator
VFADRLSTLLHGVDAAVDDPAAYNAAVSAFYDAIVEAAASRPVEVTLASLRSLVPNDFFEVIPDAIPVERNALATIASAVGRRDEDAAAEALAEVSAAISKLVVALFEERGLFDTPTSTPADQPDVAG